MVKLAGGVVADWGVCVCVCVCVGFVLFIVGLEVIEKWGGEMCKDQCHIVRWQWL